MYKKNTNHYKIRYCNLQLLLQIMIGKYIWIYFWINMYKYLTKLYKRGATSDDFDFDMLSKKWLWLTSKVLVSYFLYFYQMFVYFIKNYNNNKLICRINFKVKSRVNKKKKVEVVPCYWFLNFDVSQLYHKHNFIKTIIKIPLKIKILEYQNCYYINRRIQKILML